MHNHIRSNIVRIRKSRKITQEELAERIGMSARNFQRIENGEAKTLDASILISIAEALEVELSALFEQPSIRVDTNNGVVGGGSMVITRPC